MQYRKKYEKIKSKISQLKELFLKTKFYIYFYFFPAIYVLAYIGFLQFSNLNDSKLSGILSALGLLIPILFGYLYNVYRESVKNISNIITESNAFKNFEIKLYLTILTYFTLIICYLAGNVIYFIGVFICLIIFLVLLLSLHESGIALAGSSKILKEVCENTFKSENLNEILLFFETIKSTAYANKILAQELMIHANDYLLENKAFITELRDKHSENNDSSKIIDVIEKIVTDYSKNQDFIILHFFCVLYKKITIDKAVDKVINIIMRVFT